MTRRGRVAGALLVALAVAGCDGGKPATPAAPASDLAAEDGCATPDGGRTDSWSVGGATMRALVVGGPSPTAVVVSNGSSQQACAWVESLPLLRPYGTVWLYDYMLGGSGLDDVTAVVALSPEAELSDGTGVLDRIRGTRFPTLLVTTADDPYEAAPACRAFAAARPAVTTLSVLPGTAHGTGVLASPTATIAVRSFLAAHH